MKIRNGFVSNSSSSSFVVFGMPDKNTAWEYAVNKYCIPITNEKYKNRIIKKLIKNDDEYKKQVATNSLYAMDYYDDKTELNYLVNQPMYLSSFIPDTNEDDYRMFEYNQNTYEYYNGAFGGPYDENYFLLLDEDKEVWIKKDKEELLNDKLSEIITDDEIYKWSSLQNAKLIGHTSLSDEDYEKLLDLTDKMEYSIIELYKLENNNDIPSDDEVDYLITNGHFVCDLCIKMIPRFQKLREKIIDKYSK